MILFPRGICHLFDGLQFFTHPFRHSKFSVHATISQHTNQKRFRMLDSFKNSKLKECLFVSQSTKLVGSYYFLDWGLNCVSYRSNYTSCYPKIPLFCRYLLLSKTNWLLALVFFPCEKDEECQHKTSFKIPFVFWK